MVTVIIANSRLAATAADVWWNVEQLPAVDNLWALILTSALQQPESQSWDLVPELPPPSAAVSIGFSPTYDQTQSRSRKQTQLCLPESSVWIKLSHLRNPRHDRQTTCAGGTSAKRCSPCPRPLHRLPGLVSSDRTRLTDRRRRRSFKHSTSQSSRSARKLVQNLQVDQKKRGRRKTRRSTDRRPPGRRGRTDGGRWGRRSCRAAPCAWCRSLPGESGGTGDVELNH